MTVGQELTKITDFRLFHNHMTIEPVIEIFGQFNPKVIHRLREVIFEEFASSDCYGLIFTIMWAFDMQSDCVTVLPVIDSTNQYLLDRIGELKSGDACVAEYQDRKSVV